MLLDNQIDINQKVFINNNQEQTFEIVFKQNYNEICHVMKYEEAKIENEENQMIS